MDCTCLLIFKYFICSSNANGRLMSFFMYSCHIAYKAIKII